VVVQAFIPQSSFLSCHSKKDVSSTRRGRMNTNDNGNHRNQHPHVHHAARERNFLMDEFKTTDGKIVNPYYTLRVHRESSSSEIRKAYRDLSKRYHPDTVRNSKALPDNCDTLDQVQNEWERVQLSYEILSNKRTKLRYDRHSALHNDPVSAVSRAAVGAMSWGVSGLAKSLVTIGKSVVDEVQTTETNTNNN
jgi:DnaJ-class molecular chaperone